MTNAECLLKMRQQNADKRWLKEVDTIRLLAETKEELLEIFTLAEQYIRDTMKKDKSKYVKKCYPNKLKRVLKYKKMVR